MTVQQDPTANSSGDSSLDKSAEQSAAQGQSEPAAQAEAQSLDPIEQLHADLAAAQAQLAERLGLSQRRVSELEREPGTLSVDQLLTMCAQLGLQLSVQPRDKTPPVNAAQTGEW